VCQENILTLYIRVQLIINYKHFTDSF